ncbi:MAG: hypothetical protein V1719_01325 [Patescibacteria group bacterium]
MNSIVRGNFIQLLFLQIATKYTEHTAWFTLDDDILHPTIFGLQQKYGAELPVLTKFHFTTVGTFPFSQELAEAMVGIRVSYFVKLTMPHDAAHFYCHLLSKDSAEFLEQTLQDIFGDNATTRKAFGNCADDLYTKIRRCSPCLVP